MRNLIFAAAMFMGVAVSSAVQAQDCTTPPNSPFLNVRNFVPGSTVVGLYSSKVQAYTFEYTRNVLKGNAIPNMSPLQASTQCGVGLAFNTGWGIACSANPIQNIYNIQIVIQTGPSFFTQTQTKNICSESVLDLMPKSGWKPFQVQGYHP